MRPKQDGQRRLPRALGQLMHMKVDYGMLICRKAVPQASFETQICERLHPVTPEGSNRFTPQAVGYVTLIMNRRTFMDEYIFGLELLSGGLRNITQLFSAAARL